MFQEQSCHAEGQLSVYPNANYGINTPRIISREDSARENMVAARREQQRQSLLQNQRNYR